MSHHVWMDDFTGIAVNWAVNDNKLPPPNRMTNLEENPWSGLATFACVIVCLSVCKHPHSPTMTHANCLAVRPLVENALRLKSHKITKAIGKRNKPVSETMNREP